MVRYLVIVGRREPKLYDYLTRQFAGDASVRVIVDRRENVRRQQGRPRAPERRRRERRDSSELPHLSSVRLVRLRLGTASPAPTTEALPDEPNATRPIIDRKEGFDANPGESCQRLLLWLEDSRSVFALIPRVIEELRAAERECERLQRALADCRVEQEQLRVERAELAEALTSLVGQMRRPLQELTAKLRRASEDPP